jgi:hypothetical protein
MPLLSAGRAYRCAEGGWGIAGGALGREEFAALLR